MSILKIRCYDGTELKWEKHVIGGPSEIQVETMLQRLVCMGLNANEIIGASNRKNAKNRNELLDCLKRDGAISCGHSPYYIATWEAD